MRPVWFLVGLALWAAVGVSLFAMWSRAPEKAAEGEAVTFGQPATAGDSTNTIVVSPGSSGIDVDDEDEAPIVPVEVKPTWSDEGISDFSFTERSGEAVSKNDLLGKPWIASFIFTRCAGPCPRVAEAVKTLQGRYDDRDVRFVTFTVDPKNDSPEVLTKFADFWDADPERWFFLTGDQDKIYRLINTDFLMPVMEDPNPKPGWEIIHTTNVCLVDPTGRVVGKYNSVNEKEVAVLRRDLDAMLDQLETTQAELAEGDE